MKKMSESEIEKSVNYVISTMAFEGMFLTEEEIEALKEIGRLHRKNKKGIYGKWVKNIAIKVKKWNI